MYFIIISSLHHRQCGHSSLAACSRLWAGAILTASVSVRLWDLRSSRTIFIQVIRRRPGGLFQSSGVTIYSCNVPKQKRHCACRSEDMLSAALRHLQWTFAISCLAVFASTVDRGFQSWMHPLRWLPGILNCTVGSTHVVQCYIHCCVVYIWVNIPHTTRPLSLVKYFHLHVQ